MCAERVIIIRKSFYGNEGSTREEGEVICVRKSYEDEVVRIYTNRRREGVMVITDEQQDLEGRGILYNAARVYRAQTTPWMYTTASTSQS